MRYVIMADGKGSRWNNFMGHKKHDISVSGETLLERTVRLVHKFDDAAEVIITSHDESVSIPGAVRYEPKNNVLEIDRFTAELIDDDMCFLYGDVLYSENAVKAVISSICAVLVGDGELFRNLYLEVRRRFLAGEIDECKGWQVYLLYAGYPLTGRRVGKNYVLLDSFTRDFNSPEDYLDFMSEN